MNVTIAEDAVVPHKAVRALRFVCILFVCILLILIIPIKRPLVAYDEGVAVFNATRIMAGEAAYPDFWAVYPPGQSYALAAVFNLFGTSLMTARVYDTVVRLIIVLCIYAIGLEFTSFSGAAIIALATAIFFGPFTIYGYALFPAFALDLLAILSLFAYGKGRKRRWLLLSGLFLGIAAIFRWDIALYAGASITLSLLLFLLLEAANSGNSHSGTLWIPLWIAVREVALVVATAIAVIVVSYGYFSYRSGAVNLLEQAVIFPITKLPVLRWRAYPALIPSHFVLFNNLAAVRNFYADLMEWLRFYGVLMVYGIALLTYGSSLLSGRANFDWRSLQVCVITLFGLLLFIQALSRYDYFHVAPTSMMALCVLVSLPMAKGLRWLNRRSQVALIVPLCALGMLYLASPVRSLLADWMHFSPLACYSRLERAACIAVKPDQAEAVEYIRAATDEGEQIFVGNSRHDLIFVNDVSFYFLANRPSATKYDELFPGVATTLPVQEQIVHELESGRTEWIVLVDEAIPMEPNASAISSQVNYLDQYIQSNYERVKTFDAYKILRRVAHPIK